MHYFNAREKLSIMRQMTRPMCAVPALENSTQQFPFRSNNVTFPK